MSVYANGREVSGKAQPNKIIAGFPSVCLSPPSPPAGPIPIPYPMFTDASKTTGGAKSVKIKRKETGKANKSTYKSSKGNEAATRSFGMDVVSHTLSGATKHQAYSFDVKAEGKGVNRFMDLTTTNHNNPATAATINAAGVDLGLIAPDNSVCRELEQATEAARTSLGEHNTKAVRRAGDDSSTVTSARYVTADGVASSMRASSKKPATRLPGFVEGITYEDKHGAKRGSKSGELSVEDSKSKLGSRVCDGDFQYDSGYFRPHCSHTEARILEHIFQPENRPPAGPDGKMGTLMLNIDWPGGEKVTGKTTKDACDHCERLLCHASKCMDIYLCKEGNTPEKVECQDDTPVELMDMD